MKLKKIASLALAGIMAVSMLAGCSTSGNGNSGSSSEVPVTPSDDVAAVVNAQLDNNADVITFENDSVIAGIMTSYFEDHPLTNKEWNSELLYVANNKYFSGFMTSGVNSYLGGTLYGDFASIDSNKNDGTKDGTYYEIYLLDDEAYSLSEAAERIGLYLDDVALPENDGGMTVNYSYDGTVSIVKAESESGAESMWVAVVTIARDHEAR